MVKSYVRILIKKIFSRKKTLASSNFLKSWDWYVYFLKLNQLFYFGTKFCVSSIILTVAINQVRHPTDPNQDKIKFLFQREYLYWVLKIRFQEFHLLLLGIFYHGSRKLDFRNMKYCFLSGLKSRKGIEFWLKAWHDVFDFFKVAFLVLYYLRYITGIFTLIFCWLYTHFRRYLKIIYQENDLF